MAETNEVSLHQKLLKVQSEIGAISKKANNPFFKSKYFDINMLIAEVLPILNKHGITLLQPINDGEVCSAISDGNEVIESRIALPDINDPQKLGSAITYFRRYTLQSLLALQAEDDDANLASGKVAQKQKLTESGFQAVMKSDRDTALKALKTRDVSPDHLNQIKTKFNL
jgi:hypothetical protein